MRSYLKVLLSQIFRSCINTAYMRASYIAQVERKGRRASYSNDWVLRCEMGGVSVLRQPVITYPTGGIHCAYVF